MLCKIPLNVNKSLAVLLLPVLFIRYILYCTSLLPVYFLIPLSFYTDFVLLLVYLFIRFFTLELLLNFYLSLGHENKHIIFVIRTFVYHFENCTLFLSVCSLIPHFYSDVIVACILFKLQFCYCIFTCLFPFLY